ncbi:hypothetical protein [Pelomonas sp. Root1444]|uniref:hypothetical protein n=1 Tax=Pelomonas sp. Root1444 TaxID=1736464 RepID=UPI0012F967C8|nr:hypothetical protein [Pelomonas sp. Root1444]
MPKYCATCRIELAPEAAACFRCSGSEFVDIEQPETLANAVARTILRLFVGGAVWLGFMVLAMIGGFFGSMSAGKTLFVLAWALAFAAIVWAAAPVVGFFGRK